MAEVRRPVEALRAEVREWLAVNWSEDITVREWWRRLADAGYTAPTWPRPYGLGVSASEARAISAELAAAKVVAPPTGVVGVRLAGPTLLEHGTDEQRAAYLPPLQRGEEAWCQLWSEPGAGSDLPSLSTRAEPDGDGWRVNGQKVWNSGADIARRGLLLARTDPAAPKRAGLTTFVIDMDQPGIEARPLRQMNGEAHFCEVFLTDARVDAGEVVGSVGAGWEVTRTTLLFERMTATERVARGLVFVDSGHPAGNLDRTTGDVLAAAAARTTPRFTGTAIRAREMMRLAQEQGVATDPVLRDRLAGYWSLAEVHRLTQQRAAASVRLGRPPGPEGSISKLLLGRICTTSRDLSFDIVGAEALLDGDLVTVGLSSPAVTIGAGTDEIQRNILAEKVLGLPREPGLE
jgi:alkylation response protein AidB-like acyl-CoA dehydrogenase